MPLLQAIVLAVVQGVTEFLPISSSAHLVMIPWFAGWTEPGLAFEVALHVGTLFAVLLYFLRDWVELVSAGFGIRALAGKPEEYGWKQKLFWLLVIGTIPGGIVGMLFERKIEENMTQPTYVAALMIVVGLLMWIADSLKNLNRHIPEINTTDALAIGGAQALALFPGVSRSGITIITGLARHLTRESAARFSCLAVAEFACGKPADADELVHRPGPRACENRLHPGPGAGGDADRRGRGGQDPTGIAGGPAGGAAVR